MSPLLDSRLCDLQVELSWSDANLSGIYKVLARCTIRSFAFIAPQCGSPQVLADGKDTHTDPGHTAYDVQEADGLPQLAGASEFTTALVGIHWGCMCSTGAVLRVVLHPCLHLSKMCFCATDCGIHSLVGKPPSGVHSSKGVPTHLSAPFYLMIYSDPSIIFFGFNFSLNIYAID